MTPATPRTVLFIINASQEHRPFYASVGDAVERLGHRAAYAVDSRFTEFLHPDTPLAPARIFTDYFREHFGRTALPPGFGDVNVARAFFPDIDRLTWTAGGKRRDERYYESLVANLAWFFHELFDAMRPDLVVYENVSNSFVYFAYLVARARGIPFLGLVSARLPRRLDLLDRETARNSSHAALYARVRAGEVVAPREIEERVTAYIETFDEQVPDYMHGSRFEMNVVKRYGTQKSLERVVRTIEYALRARDDHHYAYQVANPFIAYPEQLLREQVRQVKRKYLEARRYERSPDLSRKFFVYPIQFHPESSTSVDGPAFLDDWSNITGILQNLPHGTWLYVKDHRHAAGRPSIEFYERISRLPNVVLVHPDFPPKRLVRASVGVICSTSTMGWEALVLRRPVFILGEPFYDFFPGCIRIASFATAFEQLRMYDRLEITAEDARALVTSYFLCTEDGAFDVTTQTYDADKVAWIARLIDARLRT